VLCACAGYAARKNFSALRRKAAQSVNIFVVDFCFVRTKPAYFFAEKSYSAEYGARNAARLIEDEFITPLTDLILFGDAAEGKTVLFGIADKTKQPYVSVRIQDA